MIPSVHVVNKYLQSAATRSPLVPQIVRSTFPAILAPRSSSFSNIAWSHQQCHQPFYEPHLTVQHNLAESLESTADMYESETSVLERMEDKVASQRTATVSKEYPTFPGHNFSQTASDLVDEAYKRDTTDAFKACKVNVRLFAEPDFFCSDKGPCMVNYQNGIAVPPVEKDCMHGPCLSLNVDPCLDAVYQHLKEVEPVHLGCKYGRSCPLPINKQTHVDK